MVEAVKAQARREMQKLEAELLGVISSMEEQVKPQITNRRGNTLKGLEDFCLKAKAKIRP